MRKFFGTPHGHAAICLLATAAVLASGLYTQLMAVLLLVFAAGVLIFMGTRNQ